MDFSDENETNADSAIVPMMLTHVFIVFKRRRSTTKVLDIYYVSRRRVFHCVAVDDGAKELHFTYCSHDDGGDDLLHEIFSPFSISIV